MADRDELAALRRMADLEMRAIKASQASKEETQARIESDPISRGARAFPTEEGAFLPGVGSAVAKLGIGARQVGEALTATPERLGATLRGGPPLSPELEAKEAERRRLNVPLERTATGRLGQLVGDIGMVAPATLIPGLNTIVGSALIGGGIGALQPTLEDESRLGNVAIGAGLAGGVSASLKGIAYLRSVRQSKGLTEQAKNALRDETIKEGFEAGYVVPPSAVHKGGTFVRNRLEGIGGKAALNQESSIRNQEITNRLARKAAGLADDAPLSEASLREARNVIAAPYRDIAALSPRAESALEGLKQARYNANRQYKHYYMTGDPAIQDKAEYLLKQADLFERVITKEAARVGRSDLLPALKEARKALAKNYDVERAINLGTGEVDASVLGRMLDSGKFMTGELRTIAKFHQAFPQFMREASKVQAPGVSKLEAFGGAALGLGGAAATGSPAGLLAAGLPFLASPTRSLLLSKMMQGVPKYGPGATLRLADLAVRTKGVQRTLPPLIAAGIVPQVQQ